MSTPEIIYSFPRINFGPISNEKIAPTTEGQLVDGATISRVLQIKTGNLNTDTVYLRYKNSPTAIPLGPSESTTMDTQNDPSTILVRGAISGLSISYASKFVLGE